MSVDVFCVYLGNDDRVFFQVVENIYGSCFEKIYAGLLGGQILQLRQKVSIHENTAW